MPRLEIHDAARRRRFEILDDAFSAGTGEEDALRLDGEGIGAAHLRFDRDARGRVRLAASPGARLNGEEVLKAPLRHGDRIALGPYLIVVCDDDRVAPEVEPEDIPAVRAERAAARARGEGLVLDISPEAGLGAPTRRAPAAGRPRAAAAARRGAARERPGDEAPRRPASRRRGMPTSMLLWNAMLVTAVVGWLIYRSFASVELVRDPEDVIELAEVQWNSGDVDGAYATLRAARERAGDDLARRKIDLAVARLRERARQLEELGEVRDAREEFDELVKFTNRWFEGAEDKRPAARAVARRILAWDEEYAEVCRKYDDGRYVLEALGKLRERVAPYHHLEEPDTADDVLFRSDRFTKLQLRRYREALALLERWLAERPAAEGAERVRAELESLREEGPRWLEDQRAAVERMVRRDEIARAVATLRFLVDEALPAEWLGELPARLAALEARLEQARLDEGR